MNGMSRFLILMACQIAFPINSNAESIEITGPVAGQQVPQNSVLTVSWKSTGIVGDVRISITVGDSIPHVIAFVPAASGTRSFWIENAGRFNGVGFDLKESKNGPVIESYYDASDKVRVSIAGSAGPFVDEIEAQTGFFTVMQPTVEVFKPQKGDAFVVGDVISLRWRTSGLNYPMVALGVSSDGGVTWQETWFYTEDTGSAKVVVSSASSGKKGVFDLNTSNTGGNVTLGYFENLPFSRTYKFRIRAGASEGSGTTEGNFSILPAGAAVITRQVIKGQVGSRVHVRIRKLNGLSSYKGVLPPGLKFKRGLHWIVGRPTRAVRRRIQFTDKLGAQTIAKFVIRKHRPKVSGRL